MTIWGKKVPVFIKLHLIFLYTSIKCTSHNRGVPYHLNIFAFNQYLMNLQWDSQAQSTPVMTFTSVMTFTPYLATLGPDSWPGTSTGETVLHGQSVTQKEVLLSHCNITVKAHFPLNRKYILKYPDNSFWSYPLIVPTCMWCTLIRIQNTISIYRNRHLQMEIDTNTTN